jgi:glycerol kinase
VRVVRPVEVESTGRGAAMLAGVGADLTDLAAATRMVKLDRDFSPKIDEEKRRAHIARWRHAVAQTRA